VVASTPWGPTGYANSPYQSLSSFAGNWLLISPARLIEDGLVSKSACEGPSFPGRAVDYDAVITFKHRLLDVCWFNFSGGVRQDLGTAYETFCHCHARWLYDYALFRALKVKYKGTYYLEWPIELVQRSPSVLAQVRRELAREIDKICFAQFLLFRQADQLHILRLRAPRLTLREQPLADPGAEARRDRMSASSAFSNRRPASPVTEAK
jgi:4-alpha-glucanotransferase